LNFGGWCWGDERRGGGEGERLRVERGELGVLLRCSGGEDAVGCCGGGRKAILFCSIPWKMVGVVVVVASCGLKS
jgi:hypothetical protein